MSGNTPGPQAELKIKKKNPAQYPPDLGHPGKKKIHKESDVQAIVATPQTTRVKLGLRIKASQTVAKFAIHSRTPHGDIPLSAPPYGEAAAIIQELTTVLGAAADEQWVVYYADYHTKYGKNFDTEIELAPFEIHPNGFQVVTVVFTHQTRHFDVDNYSFGVSVVPGENSAGLELPFSVSRTSTKKAAARGKTRTSRAPKKSKKKRSR
jgi:hypothetical protein